MVAISRNSKPDTVLLLDTAPADPWVDYSQLRTDLADQGTYLSEASSARTAINTPREISIVVDHATGQSGVLLSHGNNITYGYRVDISSNSVFVRENGSTRATVSLPDHNAAGRKFLIHWSKHADGTNRSELMVYNFTAGTFAHMQTTHAVGAGTNASHTLTVGAAFGGLNTYTGGLGAFHFVRIGRRFHSTTEAREDWITQTTPPATTMLRRSPVLAPDRSTLTNLGTDGSFAGPPHLWAADAFEQSDRRLMGPMTNMLGFDDWIDIAYTFAEYSTAWWRVAPGPGDFRFGVPCLWYRSVPGKCNRVRVSVQTQQMDSSGDVTAPISYRFYSMVGYPTSGDVQTPIAFTHTETATSAVEDGAGGTWRDLGSCGLQVDENGMTWLGLGIAIDTSGSLHTTTSLKLFNVRVEPYYDGETLDGIDQADGVGI